MPILSRVGKRTWSRRSAVFAIYTCLLLGSVTMIYPFMVMVSTSTANAFDYHDFSPLPTFLWDDTTLFWKYLTMRDGQIEPGKYRVPDLSWEQIKKRPAAYLDECFGPELRRNPTQRARQAEDFEAFLATLPIELIELHSRERYEMRYPDFIRQHYIEKLGRNDDAAALALYNRENQEDHTSFYTITFWGGQGYPYPTYFPDPTGPFARVQAFKQHLGPNWYTFTPTRSRWQQMLRQSYGEIRELNEAWQSDYAYFGQIDFPLSPPERTLPRGDWNRFVNKQLPLIQQRLSPDAAAQHQLPQAMPDDADLRRQWITVMQNTPPEQRMLDLPMNAYIAFLQERYTSPQQAGAAYGLNWSEWQQVYLPFDTRLVVAYLDNPSRLRWHFLTTNYVRVISYITTRGRALFNTVVLCLLTVISALTVNPLAAYALSRFRMRSAPKILLFMLATMAFPAEVAMIPSFLLIRDLGMLNTFAALVIPGMASGFSIFLLKGFFDSLPQELYEAAELDGAGEVRKFLTIAMPLSKPILAVIALGSFTAAYTGFMWALVVCQDPKMWTIMVWLFAFQGQVGTREPHLAMASFVVASLPPLIVFLFCQRIILRGIIIPTMK